jgi:hypothetical protein
VRFTLAGADGVVAAALSNQVKSFYRDGTFADCNAIWNNTTECLRLVRLSTQDANVSVRLESVCPETDPFAQQRELVRVRLSQPEHSATVWPLRANPAKDWYFAADEKKR